MAKNLRENGERSKARERLSPGSRAGIVKLYTK